MASWAFSRLTGDLTDEAGGALAGMLSPDEKIDYGNISTLFVPEIKEMTDFLHETSKNNFMPALVVDELGNVTGAIGGEPLIAKIVRTRTSNMQRVLEFPNTSIVLRGDTPIEHLETITGQRLPRGPYQTIAGFILEILHRIPNAGTTIDWDVFQFKVLSADRRRIQRIEVKRIR